MIRVCVCAVKPRCLRFGPRVHGLPTSARVHRADNPCARRQAVRSTREGAAAAGRRGGPLDTRDLPRDVRARSRRRGLAARRAAAASPSRRILGFGGLCPCARRGGERRKTACHGRAAGTATGVLSRMCGVGPESPRTGAHGGVDADRGAGGTASLRRRSVPTAAHTPGCGRRTGPFPGSAGGRGPESWRLTGTPGGRGSARGPGPAHRDGGRRGLRW